MGDYTIGKGYSAQCKTLTHNSVVVHAFPRRLFWVVLMCYHSSTGQNQSEEKGFVTPSFSRSRCNMTLEKIDQEMYFWSQLSIASPLTFKALLLLVLML